MKPKLIMFAVAALVAIVAFLAMNPICIIDPGERGVVLTWGKPSQDALGEGLHILVPLAQKVVRFDVRTTKHEVKVVAYSRDTQTVDSVVALNYHLNPESVVALLKEIGPEYQGRIIDPAIQESVKAAASRFTAQQLIEERPTVKEEIKAQLLERLNGRHIVVDDFSIVNFDFSDAYESAVEAKQVAQQNALKASNDLTRIKVEAEQKIAQAKAEAESIRIQAEAITQQGGADYVAMKAVEKWNGQLPTQMIPGAAVPFVNVTASASK